MGKTTDRMIVNGVTYEIIDAVSRAQTETMSEEIGNTELPTTAQTLTGAIAEHEEDLTDIKSALEAVDKDNSPERYSIDFALTIEGKWSAAGKGYIVPCDPGDVIVLKNTVRTSYYTILKSADNIVAFASADYATGYSGITSYAAETTITVPSDGHFIWLYKYGSGLDYTPTKFTINGYNYLKSIRANIAEAFDDIEGLTKTTNDIDGNVVTPMLSKYTLNSSGKWVYTGYNCSLIIPIVPSSTIEIELIGNASYYSLLKSNTITSGESADYATGYTGFKGYNTEKEIIAPNDANYLWLYINDGANNLIPSKLTVNGYPVLKNLKQAIADNTEAVEDIQNNLFDTYDIADGLTDQLTPYDGSNLKYHEENTIAKRKPVCGRIVAMNHDDLQRSDYVNIRKVYNKYGFNANFNLLVELFPNVVTIREKRINVRRMVADGNEIGFHAPVGGSFWWMNKMIDIRPDGSFSFAPTLSQIITAVSDGLNAFGYTVDLTQPLSYYGFAQVPSAYASTPVSSLTTDTYKSIMATYTHLFNTGTVTGLDLDNVSRTWTPLYWLEYWYNNLIDDSLGYTDNSSIANVYVDYETGENGSYPDVTHMLNGKMVFYDDTDNPNYSVDGYQIVGRFTKGLFKGAATACNYEVRGRIIEIAKAYMKHYFGVERFSLYGRHGIKYIDDFWHSNGVPYDDVGLNVLAGEFGRTYNSISQKFETGLTVLAEHGIRMTNHDTPLIPVFKSQYGLYKGQSASRSPFFACADLIRYLVIAGSTSSDAAGSSITTANLLKILGEHDDPLKFVYENAGQTVTSSDGQTSCYIQYDIRIAIDLIRQCYDTGKIPFLSVDTIANTASNIYAVEMLCQYCYHEGITIVTPEKAREIAVSSNWEWKKNYFPNPTFVSSILKMFGGSSTANDAYRPDGWGKLYGTLTNAVITEDDNQVYQISTDGAQGFQKNYVEIWGLPAGEYQFSCKAKKTGGEGTIDVYLMKNKSKVADGGSFVQSVGVQTSTYGDVEVTFTIPEPTSRVPDSSPESQYSNGYDDNVVSVQFIVGFENASGASANTISIYNPKLIML